MRDRGADEQAQVILGGHLLRRRIDQLLVARVDQNRSGCEEQQAEDDQEADSHFPSIHHHWRTHHRGRRCLHPIPTCGGRSYVLIYIYSAE